MELHDTTIPLRPDWLPEAVWPFPLHDLDVDGRRMVYSDTGGGGPALLLVHVGLWSLLWRGLIAELAPRYRCITFDPPGSGLSEPAPTSLADVSNAIGCLIRALDLRDVTLVVHDTGGWASLGAVGSDAALAGRISRLVAVNTFGWRPHGILRLALLVMGSAPIRELTVWTGVLAWASGTRLGVGRHFDRVTRKAWRRGLRDRSKRRFLHRMFADAARDRALASAAECGVAALADRPTLTVFGQFGDYFRFRRGWRRLSLDPPTRSRRGIGASRLRPGLSEATVPFGLHFPQSDDPVLVADAIDDLVCRSTRSTSAEGAGEERRGNVRPGRDHRTRPGAQPGIRSGP